MSNYSSNHLLVLLEQVAEKAALALTRKNTDVLVYKINKAPANRESAVVLNQRYLWETIYRQAKRKPDATLKLDADYVAVITGYLGFRDFETWVKENPKLAIPLPDNGSNSEPQNPTVEHEQREHTKTFNYDVLLIFDAEKDDIFGPSLLFKLEQRGIRVWSDRLDQKLGTSRWGNLNEALKQSAKYHLHTLIIISPHLWENRALMNCLRPIFQLNQQELDRIIPILHQVSTAEVMHALPLLADRALEANQLNLDLLTLKLEAVIANGAIKKGAILNHNASDFRFLSRITQDKTFALIEILERALVTNASKLQYNIDLGLIYLHIGVYDKAEDYLSIARKLAPDNAKTSYYLALALSGGRPQKNLFNGTISRILDLLNHSLSLNDQLAYVWLYRAFVSSTERKVAEAAYTVDEMLEKFTALRQEDGETARLIHVFKLGDHPFAKWLDVV